MKNINRKESGFTIIEVVLVLAIAGLIFLMVFIALPALQRSQRDAQRKNDLARLNTALSSYQSNNRGALPSGFTGTGTTTWPSMVSRYVTVNSDTFADPTGNDYALQNDTNPTAAITANFDSASPIVYVAPGYTCNGEVLTSGQGSRKVAFRMKLEGSGVACVNN